MCEQDTMVFVFSLKYLYVDDLISPVEDS